MSEIKYGYNVWPQSDTPWELWERVLYPDDGSGYINLHVWQNSNCTSKNPVLHINLKITFKNKFKNHRLKSKMEGHSKKRGRWGTSYPNKSY